MSNNFVQASTGDNGTVPPFFESPYIITAPAIQLQPLSPTEGQVLLEIRNGTPQASKDPQFIPNQYISPAGVVAQIDSKEEIITPKSGVKKDPITLTFKDLSYSVQVKNSEKGKPKSKVDLDKSL